MKLPIGFKTQKHLNNEILVKPNHVMSSGLQQLSVAYDNDSAYNNMRITAIEDYLIKLSASLKKQKLSVPQFKPLAERYEGLNHITLDQLQKEEADLIKRQEADKKRQIAQAEAAQKKFNEVLNKKQNKVEQGGVKN